MANISLPPITLLSIKIQRNCCIFLSSWKICKLWTGGCLEQLDSWSQPAACFSIEPTVGPLGGSLMDWHARLLSSNSAGNFHAELEHREMNSLPYRRCHFQFFGLCIESKPSKLDNSGCKKETKMSQSKQRENKTRAQAKTLHFVLVGVGKF